MSVGEPRVPKGVLRGIDDLANGRTASMDDLIEATED